MAKKQTRVNPTVLKDLVDFMNSPTGGGDMLKSVYDVGNTGTVDQAKDSDTLDGQHAAAFATASHAAAHQDAGADEVNVAGLSGELADPQPPKAHTHPGGDVTSQVGDADTVDGSHAADFASSGHNHDTAYAPIAKGVTNGDAHDHVGGDGAAIAEGALSLADVTTGDVSTTKHGFAPKAPNDTSKFLRGDGTWAAPAGGGLGYALAVTSLILSTLSDGSTYYFGLNAIAPATTANNNRVYIPKAGTIKAAYIFAAFVAGSDESASLYIRKNNSSDTLIASLDFSFNPVVFSNGGLNIAVNAGDYIELKLVCPTWATNPSQLKMSGHIYVE